MMISLHTVAHAPKALFRSRSSYSLIAVGFCLSIAAAIPATASDIQVVTIEEDWELTILDPDPDSASPQIACVLAPLGHVDGLHAVFEINHRTQPDFTSGGMQLQLWNGESLNAYGNYPNPSLLNSPSETIRWTQRMHLEGGQLIMEITNGASTTWGSFGGQGYLRHAVPTDLSNLNSYLPSVVVAKSGISYAANRVGHLVLKEIRLVTSNGDTHIDNTARFVHGN